MASNHLILCRPLLLPPSIFPSIRVFSNEWWPKCWSFSFSRPVGSQRVGHGLVTEQQQQPLRVPQSQFLGRREGASGSGWRKELWRGVPSPPRSGIPEASQPKESGLAGPAPGHRAPGDGRRRCPQGFGSRVRASRRQPRVRSSRAGMGGVPQAGARRAPGKAGGPGSGAGSGRAVQKARGPRSGPEPLNRAPNAVNFGKSCFIIINCV